MKHLYFTRHGESQLNLEQRFAGHTNTPLTKVGRDQARLAAAHAKGLGIDYIITSPLSRAHDTAKIIAAGLGIMPDAIEMNSLIIERSWGSLEGTPWNTDLDLDGFTDIETINSIDERAKLALEHIATIPNVHNILMVSHGSFGAHLYKLIHPELTLEQVPHFGNAEIMQFI